MKNKGTLYLVQAAVIGAIYVVLTMLFAPISFGPIQFRISEALCVLPCFTPAAIPGLFVGCMLANYMGGSIIVDVIFGSLATLIGAFFTYKLRGSSRFLAVIPPIAANTVIVPFVLYYGYGYTDAGSIAGLAVSPIPYMMITVFIGEVIACGILGVLLYTVLRRYASVIFAKAY